MLDWAERNHIKAPATDIATFVCLAIEHSHTEIAAWLVNRGHSTWDQCAIDALDLDNAEMFQWIVTSQKITHHLTAQAIARGSLFGPRGVLCTPALHHRSEEVVIEAIQCTRIADEDMLSDLINHGFEIGEKTLSYLAKNDRIDLFRSITARVHPTNSTLETAIRNRATRIAKWLLDQERLKFEPVSTCALLAAVRNNDVNIVIRLYEKRLCSFNEKTLETAMVHSRHSIALFLMHKGCAIPPKWGQMLLDWSTGSMHQLLCHESEEVREKLRVRFYEASLKIRSAQEAVIFWAEIGRLDLLKWLHARQSNSDWAPAVFEAAKSHSRWEMINWLSETKTTTTATSPSTPSKGSAIQLRIPEMSASGYKRSPR